jgi:hypothetical protein
MLYVFLLRRGTRRCSPPFGGGVRFAAVRHKDALFLHVRVKRESAGGLDGAYCRPALSPCVYRPTVPS